MVQADILRGTLQHARHLVGPDRLTSRCKMLHRGLPVPAAVLRQAAGTGVEWSQTVDSVSLSVKLPAATPRSSLTVKLQPQVISINVAGDEVLGGNLPGPIVAQDSDWTIERDTATGDRLELLLVKASMGHNSWEGLLESDVPIEPDTKITNWCSMQLVNPKDNDRKLGTVVFGLYGKASPAACQSFLNFCSGTLGPTYQGTQLAGSWPPAQDPLPSQAPFLVGGIPTDTDLSLERRSRLLKRNTAPPPAAGAAEAGRGASELQAGRLTMTRGPVADTWMVALQDAAEGIEDAHLALGEVVLGKTLLRRMAQRFFEPGFQAVVGQCGEMSANEWRSSKIRLQLEQPWEDDEIVEDYPDKDEHKEGGTGPLGNLPDSLKLPHDDFDDEAFEDDGSGGLGKDWMHLYKQDWQDESQAEASGPNN